MTNAELLDRAVRNIRGIEGSLRALYKISKEFAIRRQELEEERDKLLNESNNGEKGPTD